MPKGWICLTFMQVKVFVGFYTNILQQVDEFLFGAKPLSFPLSPSGH